MFTKDLKYCLLTWDKPENDFVKSFGDEQLPISGLFLWKKAFDGAYAFPRTPDEFAEYDIIHLNVTAKNLYLISKIIKDVREAKRPKLLMNIDYSVDMWRPNFPYPQLLLQEIDKADYIFGVEEEMCSILSDSLHREIACIPHPLDTIGLSALRTTNRELRLLVSVHRYDLNFLTPWFAFKDLPRHIVTGCVGAFLAKDQCLHLYDEVQEHLNFDVLMKYTASSYVALETYSISSYGRFSAECAVLGVPCVGPSRVSSIRKCFPDLVSDTHARTKELLHTLFSDNLFYISQLEKGIDLSSQYSIENSRNLMLSFLNRS